MKRLLLILILTLSFQSWTKAEDIRDFEIEGMSIGDSLLDFYDVNILKNIDRFYYPNSKKYFGIVSAIFDKNLETYESIQFSVKPKTYEIVSISGRNYDYQNDKEACYKGMEKIFNDVKLSFPNSRFKKGKEEVHDGDVSRKSLVKVYSIYLKNGQIIIACTDWTEQITKQFNRPDSLKIGILKKEFMDWLNNEAYK